jgi:hypothetical protein
MRYTEIQSYKPEVFRRLTGVKRSTFDFMVSYIDSYKQEHRKHPTRGRPVSISTADKVLMLLMYYREYRTFLHISATYGISEMHCWRIITQTEKILLTAKDFHLPGKKVLPQVENHFEVIVVDVSEHPIERPKKNSGSITPVKRRGTH